MSSALPIEIDLLRVQQQLAVGVAQSYDLGDMLRHCGELLDLLLPGASYELVWNADGARHTLGARGKALFTDPEPAQLERLRAGELVDSGASCWLPLRLRGKLEGWLALAPGGPNVDQAAALNMLGALLAPLICALEAPASSATRTDKLRTLNDVGRELSGVLRIEDLPETIYQGTCRVLDAPQFYIALYDEQDDMLHLLFMVEDGERVQRSEAWPASSGLAGLVIRQRTVLRTDNYLRECQQRGIIPVSVAGYMAQGAWMGVPLLAKDRIVGLITVSSRSPGYRYTDEQM
jgi:GAF domain-containing protein